jgi:flagellar biosynthetic protein FliR
MMDGVMNFPLFTKEQIDAFVLVFLRVSALIAMIPIFGDRSVPITVKGGLSLFLSLLIFPFVLSSLPRMAITLMPQIFMMAGEIMIGIIIGLTSRFLFAGIQLGGELIGFQMGFSIVNVIDPITSRQVSVISQFQYLLAMLLFLNCNAHHIFINAIADSYHIISPQGFHFTGALMDAILIFSQKIFIVAIKISAPLIAVLFFTQVGLGVLARTVPQINIFIVGFPLQISVGLIFLGLTIPIFKAVAEKLFTKLEGEVNLLLRLMS